VATQLLVVTPVRNEAGHIERVAAAMAAQTRVPDLWLVADDGSEDDTAEILKRLEPGLSFMRVVDIPRAETDTSDRLALALEAKAFNSALRSVNWSDYTHVGKLDGDVELPRDYFERLLAAFDDDPRLGITGGSIAEPRGGDRWVGVGAPFYHVHGALKLYSRDCFEAIGGIQERLGWDTIDETYARMRGFTTRRAIDLVARHHRPGGSAGGRLRGSSRHGECAYIARYGLLWVLLRSFNVAARRDPRLLSGAAFLWGYLRCVIRRAARIEDDQFQAFVRRELRGRLRAALVGRGSRPRASSG
jgi:biofilm PGA synthesis N-glycosyltransferase PgaC